MQFLGDRIVRILYVVRNKYIFKKDITIGQHQCSQVSWHKMEAS